MNSNKMHDKYLPFEEERIKKHLYEGDGKNRKSIENQLKYYKDSINRIYEYQSKNKDIKNKTLKEIRTPFQIQKDERFWTMNTLLNIFYSSNRVDELVQLFKRGYRHNIPKLLNLNSWEACFGSDNLKLFFEVDLPSPEEYKKHLYKNYCEFYEHKKPNKHQFIPYILASACNKKKLEGSTQVDAIVINPDNGFAVIFEAKVLSDISYLINYDILRNQIARNIDVMLERNTRIGNPLNKRDPSKTLFVLITPKIFRESPSKRLYGYKMIEYMNQNIGVDFLHEDLPHRTKEELKDIPTRINWLTWEDFKDVNSKCSPWDIDCNTYF